MLTLIAYVCFGSACFHAAPKTFGDALACYNYGQYEIRKLVLTMPKYLPTTVVIECREP